MDTNVLEITNNLEQNLERSNNLIIAKEQNKFLESKLGRVINGAVDMGIKAVLPDLIDDDVIEIKDAFLQEGLKEGTATAVNKAVELGKNVLGIFTGDFDTIRDAKNAVMRGGLIDNVSKALDKVLDKIEDKKLINKNIVNVIRTGKDVFLNIATDKIEKSFENQERNLMYLEKYLKSWEKAYKKQDFDTMEKEHKKIKERLDKLMPIESILTKSRQIENLHNLIKNNGKNFNISQYEKQVAQMLA